MYMKYQIVYDTAREKQKSGFHGNRPVSHHCGLVYDCISTYTKMTGPIDAVWEIKEQFRVSMPLKSGSAHSISAMHQFSSQKNANQIQEIEKVPFVVAKKIREAILDEVFKPGDHLTEAELVEKFEVSRSPIREALLALEKEGTVPSRF